jgi:hypothetical protein
MKHETAFNFIGEQLEWTDADFAREFRELQLMIDYKYDGYQGFQPGTRFHVSLLNWLSQVPTKAEKKTIYQFVKDRLVYVSQREMHHLVSLMMPMIERTAHQSVAKAMQIPLYETYTEQAAIDRVAQLLRRTLYVGLSDGARIDVFRRYNEGKVSNEQVVAFSEITEAKWNDLRDELKKRLVATGMDQPTAEANATFDVICLVDDFSGSGSSLLRKHPTNGWGGKIKKFHKSSVEHLGSFLSKDCVLHIHHHLASARARAQIEQDLKAFAPAHPQFKYNTSFSYVLPPDVVVGDHADDAALTALLKAHYDAGIEDEHTGADIWYGYKQCGLPLVLEHNTPNNSIALLWAESTQDASPQMKPLFARRKRHSNHG